jgi:hypothetical protein
MTSCSILIVMVPVFGPKTRLVPNWYEITIIQVNGGAWIFSGSAMEASCIVLTGEIMI